MSTTDTKLVWRKLAPGMYEAAAGRDDSIGRENTNRYLAERIEQDPANGYGAGVMWVLTYPGAVRPDSDFETLRDAKAAAQRWHDIDVAVSAEEQS